VPQIINIENVSYSYPEEKKPALDGIDLSVMEGEFLAVMGENGAGKTTFCKLINGIVPHLYGGKITGTVTVDGVRTDESSVPFLATKAGMVLDDPDMQLFTSSVWHEAAFGPENLLLQPEEIKERARWALDAVGLDGFDQRLPATLSGGEKQRLAIAAALAMKGKILVLDEPLCRLDPQGATQVMSVLKEIRDRYGITVIMSTHHSGRSADRVCILKNGKIAACDTAEKIFSNRALLEENGIQVEDDVHSVFTIENKKLSGTAAIQITDFSFSYGSGLEINNINLTIEDNDFVALTGRNGCGKTTLLKNIVGILNPRAGDIYIRGKNTKNLSVSAISKDIGFVMQNPDNQLFSASVYEEVAFALKNLKLSKEEIQTRVQDALKVSGLEDMSAFPYALNRADRTKTVIACILAMGCKIIILDETDIGQDYRGSMSLMNLARELHSKGATIIFVTHNMSLVCEYAHRLIMMERNGIVKDMRRDLK
jgi:energy-coupling factor transport system ATP-binding protein